MTSDLPGSQGIRQQFNAVTLGFRVAFGEPFIFTATPDRRHSKLVWRLTRCRKNDTGLLNDDAATTRRRAYAGPDRPSLYALPEEDISEQVSLEIDIPSLEEAIAMSARDPLSTVLHFDVYVRVINHIYLVYACAFIALVAALTIIQRGKPAGRVRISSARMRVSWAAPSEWRRHLCHAPHIKATTRPIFTDSWQ